MTDRITLSEREAAVLHLLAEGRSYAQISKKLFLSEHTIKTHVQRLLRKIGARDRAHAVHLGHLAGFLGDTKPMPRPVPSSLAPPAPRTDLSDRHMADCDLFRIRYCDCRDRLPDLTTVPEGQTS